MNYKEFVTALTRKTNYHAEDVRNMLHTTVCSIIDNVAGGETVTLNGLGTFDVKKRQERVILNPATKQKMLVPPKLVVNFKPVDSLKGKIKSLDAPKQEQQSPRD